MITIINYSVNRRASDQNTLDFERGRDVGASVVEQSCLQAVVARLPQTDSARTSASSASTLSGRVSQPHMKRAPPAPMKV